MKFGVDIEGDFKRSTINCHQKGQKVVNALLFWYKGCKRLVPNSDKNF